MCIKQPSWHITREKPLKKKITRENSLKKKKITREKHVLAQRRNHRTLSHQKNLRDSSHFLSLRRASDSHGDCPSRDLLLLPSATAGEEYGVPSAPRRRRALLEVLFLCRGQRARRRGGFCGGGRATQADGRGGRRARVQVPVRARRAGDGRHRRCRGAIVRAQAAPRDRPQRRQDRQELPAGTELDPK